MTLERTPVLVIAVVVCTLGLVAATISAGTVPEGNSGAGIPENPDLYLEFFEFTNERSDGSLCPDRLDDPGTLAATVTIVGIGMVGGYRRLGSAPPVIVVGVPIALWATTCSSAVESGPASSWVLESAPSPWLLLAVLVLGLGGMIGFLWVTADERAVDVERRAGTPERPVDLGAIGAAAGDAATRIHAQADVDNEVYRAWLEMTDHLGVLRPETITPDEFETLAIEAGMRPADVSELTRIFEDVRYGERSLAGREERAVAALERIEREYAEGRE